MEDAYTARETTRMEGEEFCATVEFIIVDEENGALSEEDVQTLQDSACGILFGSSKYNIS